MSAAVVVKNTFICVVEDEVLVSPEGSRGRASTIDVATLDRQVMLALEEGEGKGVTKCSSAPPAMEAKEQVASLATGLDAGGAAAAVALDEIIRLVHALVFEAAGSNLVLRAFEVARASEAKALAGGLKGVVGEAARSSHACRVLEQIIRFLSVGDAAFIAEELLTQSPWTLVLNAHGSSILRCVIEYSSADARTLALVDAVLSADVAVLCGHKFGHEVAMSILSNGSSSQRDRILSTLQGDVQRFARHRFASKVLEQALAFCSEAERSSLALELLARPSTVVALACHNFGVNIVRELIQVPTVSQQVHILLSKSSNRISRDKFGSELMRELALDKQRTKQVLDLTRGLGLAECAVYKVDTMSFAIGGV